MARVAFGIPDGVLESLEGPEYVQLIIERGDVWPIAGCGPREVSEVVVDIGCRLGGVIMNTGGEVQFTSIVEVYVAQPEISMTAIRFENERCTNKSWTTPQPEC